VVPITAAVLVVLELLVLVAMVVRGHLAQLMEQQQLVLVVAGLVFTVQTLVVDLADLEAEALVALEHMTQAVEL
jgi:hypothetical protein